MSTPHYDVIVIGAGPAGYVAAIRAAQLGLKVASIDDWQDAQGRPSLGGTFINAGCISSMTLLESARIYHTLTHDLNEHGIQVGDIQLDVGKMIDRKHKTIALLNQQIQAIFKNLNIDCYHAHGKLISNHQIELVSLSSQNTSSVLEAEHIILATGSRPIKLDCAPHCHDLIINIHQALNMTEVPERLGIIGAGIIGLELGEIWNRLGSEVILLEAQENFLTAPDHQIAQEAYLIFCQQGLDIRLGTRVISSQVANDRVIVEYEDSEGTHTLVLDKLIVASGRQPNSDKLVSDEIELLLDENGFVHVDENCCTSLPGVYAIGDLTLLGPMLAHKGIEEGIFVAEYIAGNHNPINYNVIPSVIYTDPEIAWVGQTEQALKAIGENYNVGLFPFKASARALSMGKPEGFVKIITQAETDQILGVHIIGHQASDLIAEAVLAMEFSASAEDLARTIHAHPTISEALHEAALSIANRSIHLPPQKIY
ncbi:dihydrolipoyl dehydrogenase [methane-oxidizing endosymbiont of Gigantopelta aegis]|uniref:dihydrolipoyl dehydrogenase n=1 Tax=methane-oxidizing endosymbiont of Gigantopelta aegis TaxID=2794938 RepID=UPI0018DD2166|nr:dihydrolipoyl dehydrogenase [methane-oxidizing endosymbiont of Gigantopelta aegis]